MISIIFNYKLYINEALYYLQIYSFQIIFKDIDAKMNVN